jgi:glycosyltransferase involved in cell wall biosynthesis
LKIIFVSSALIPSGTANSINIMRSCHAMAALGHEVVLLAPVSRAAEIDRSVRDPFRHYGITANFTVKQLPCPDLPGGRSLYCFLAARFARRFKPDLVYGRYLRATYSLCRLGFPTVLELHSAIRFKGQKSRYFEKLVGSPSLLALITLTEEMAGHFRDSGEDGTAKPVLVAGCGGDPAPTPLPAPARLPRATPGYQVGFPGKLQKAKGIELIGELAALAPGHDFHVFGGSTGEIVHWRDRYPAPNLHFHGFVPPAEITACLEALDVCLLPCQKNPLNPREAIFGSPLKLFEYMAHGKAILASDFTEIREVLDEQSAVLLEPEDPAAWAAALAALSRDDLVRLGQAAKRRFETHFTREARYRRLLDDIASLRRRTL